MTTTTTTLPLIVEYYDRAAANKALREYNADLTIDFMRMAGLMGYWNQKLVEAETQLSEMEHKLTLVTATVKERVRADAAKAGEKTTEGLVNGRVDLNANVRHMVEQVRLAEAQVGYLKGTVRALAIRCDMLQQMGFGMRKEIDSSNGNMAVMKSSMQEVQRARLQRLSDLEVEDYGS